MYLKVVFGLFALLTMTNAHCQNETPLHFDSLHIDLGKISKGDQVKESFTFENTSSKPIKISLVSTCECTEAQWPSEEILSGEKGEIEFIFDSSKKEKEEVIELDVFLENTDKNGNPIIIYLSYSYEY